MRFDIEDVNHASRSWGDLAADGARIYVWPFKGSASDTSRQSPPADLLRHEIGHDLFIRYLVPSTKSEQYGGDAPDWLDEVAAIAFEGETLRAGRRRAAVRLAKQAKLIPLQKFLTMNHPEMEARPIPTSSGEALQAFEPGSEDTPRFYAMASAFYEYLVARTGSPAIVAELAAAFGRREPLDQWIVERAGRGGGVQALDADFKAWIALEPLYGGARADEGGL
ncbi:MAG TPA: hypothetical protein VF655_07345 [Allosphingosinicella sp.]